MSHEGPAAFLGPQEMRRILAVTDALGIHRESVSVPLERRGTGQLHITASSRLEIVAPADVDFDTWIAGLAARVQALDLSRLRRGS